MRSIDGKFLQVDNIEFVSVVGFAHVTGGAGDNYAVGDDNAQFMALGVGDDTMYGGGGADTLAGGSETDLLRSEEHTSELQSLMRISYAVFCLKKKINKNT